MFIILSVSALMFTLEITHACKIFQLHSDESASPTMFAITQANNNIELTVDMTNLTDSLLQITGGHGGNNYNVIKNVTDNPNVTFSDLSVKEMYTVSIPSLNLSTEIRFACNPSCCSICSPIIMDITGIKHFEDHTYLVMYRINTTAYPEVGSIQYTEAGTTNSYISLLKYVNKTHEGLLIEMKDLKNSTDYTLELIIYDIYNSYCESISSVTFHVPDNPTQGSFELLSLVETVSPSIHSKREAASFLSTREYAFVATTVGVLLILLAILLINIPKMRRYIGGSKEANLERISVKSSHNSFHSVAATSRASTCSGRQEINVLYTPLEEIGKPAYDQYEFPRKNLELKSKIGGGAFGEVYFSKAHGLHGQSGYTLVAVKKLKDKPSPEEVEAFLAEINMLKRIGTHRNIIKLLGCVTKSEPKMAIMELVMNGDLHEYLRNIRKKWNRKDGNVFFVDSDGAYIEPEKRLDIRIDEFFKETVSNPEYLPSEVLERCSKSPTRSTSPVNVSDEMIRLNPENNTPLIKDVAAPPEPALDNKELEKFALQIATGMAYLEKIDIVHRDLAARNILITRQKTLKITDFGMSRFGTYVNRNFTKIPMRWMALEALLQFRTDNKTDVWSFGVVLWEIGTLGAYPYNGIINDNVVPYLLSGQRLNRPETCTDDLYALMLKCWNFNPNLRPTFAEIVDQLSVSKNDAYVDFSKINPNYVFPPIDPTRNFASPENVDNNISA